MKKLSKSKDIARYKLLILYILKKIDMPVAGVDLTKYILEERLMDFIMYQQRLNELVAANYIAASDMNNGIIYYSITDAGADLLTQMPDVMAIIDKNCVDRTIRRLIRHSLNERSVSAYYTPIDENSNIVHIELKEGELQIMRLELHAASKKDARTICKNWRSRAAEIFAGIQ